MYLNKLYYSLLVFLSLVYKSSGIYCYYCNSANISACVDINQYDEETRTRIIPVVDCDTAIPSPVKVDFFCRKILQTVYLSHREYEVRVTRGCGWIKSENNKDCYRYDVGTHQDTACQCFHDLCNAADNVEPTTMAVLFLILSAVLYFWR